MQVDRARVVWGLMVIVALVLGLASVTLHANRLWKDRDREAENYSTSYHFNGVFMRFDSQWQRESVAANILELTSVGDGIKFSVAVFEGNEFPLRMTEEELISDSSEFLGQISGRVIRSNNAHRWPFYIAARTEDENGLKIAHYRVVIFLPGLIVMIDAKTPNELLESDPTASNPFSKNAQSLGLFVDSLTKTEEIPQTDK